MACLIFIGFSFRPKNPSANSANEDGMYATLEDEVMEYLDPSRDKAGRHVTRRAGVQFTMLGGSSHDL